MKKTINAFLFLFFLTWQSAYAETEDATWGNYQDILKSVVTVNAFTSIDGKFGHASVDYERIQNDPALQEKITLQVERLQTVKPLEEERYKLAFWINAYNFFTIVDVVNNYPVTGMKEIGWKNRRHDVDGTLYSLDDIEHNLIRPLADPRIHFAINCASVGCPSLITEIYTVNHIERQLDYAVTNALRNPLHLRLVPEKRISTTQLFKWFGKDFETDEFKGVEDFINTFAPERLRNVRQIKNYIKYDWNLNTEQNVLNKMQKLGEQFPALKLRRE